VRWYAYRTEGRPFLLEEIIICHAFIALIDEIKLFMGGLGQGGA
jgi:hypothetical protein